MRHPLLPTICVLALAACGEPDQNFSAIYPAVTVGPPTVEFLPTIVGETAFVDLYVNNEEGNTGSDLAFTLDGDDAFDLDGELPLSIDKDEALTVRVTFSPTEFLDYTGTLSIQTDNEPDGNADQADPIVIPLSGTGVDSPKPDIHVETPVIDFGEVPQGETAIEFFEIENRGNAPLNLDLVELSGSGFFGLETLPALATIPDGNALPVIVTYSPEMDVGDNGTITINSDDPDEPVVEVTLIGNGGGDLPFPEAILECPAEGNPPGFVTVDGSASVDPEGEYPLEYVWTVTPPDNSTSAEFTDPSSSVTDLYMDVAGPYLVQLVVFNALGIPSPPAFCAIDGAPADAIHVELTWDTPSADLDLHLVENDGELFEIPSDCTWCNRAPDWGEGGSSDDPRLDLDDLGGFGPENINVFEPASGRYHVKVHYYEDNGDFAVTARVKVWLGGDEIWDGNKVMSRNDVWEVGQINWPEATFAPNGDLKRAGPTRECFTP